MKKLPRLIAAVSLATATLVVQPLGLSFRASAINCFPSMNRYTASGTKYIAVKFLSSCGWTVPAGVTNVSVVVVGGGGGGAGGGYLGYGGGGGAGGAVATNTSYAVTAGASVSVVIGTGGTAGTVASRFGDNGGATSFGSVNGNGGDGGGNGADASWGGNGATAAGNGGHGMNTNAPNRWPGSGITSNLWDGSTNVVFGAGGGGGGKVGRTAGTLGISGNYGPNGSSTSGGPNAGSGGDPNNNMGLGGNPLANFGAGGGGGGYYGSAYQSGANGGSGIVLIRYIDTSVDCSNRNITGKVFDDLSMDGAIGGSEAGIAGVGVRAFDDTGAEVASGSTQNDGTFSLNVTSCLIRVEFETPSGYESSFAGTDNASSIQFLNLGLSASAGSNVNYGVQNPAGFCGSNPTICTVTQYPGAAQFASGNSLLGNKYNGLAKDLAIAAEPLTTTGALWGLGYARNGIAYQSAMVRSYVDIGARGLGGIYMSYQKNCGAGGQPACGPFASFNLEDLGIPFGNAELRSGVVPSTRALLSGLRLPMSDPIGTKYTQRAGVGDIEVSPDQKYLWIVNAYDHNLYRLDLAGATTASSGKWPTLANIKKFVLPTVTGCSSADTAPWALKANTANVLIGLTCTAQSTQLRSDLKFEIISLNNPNSESGNGIYSTIFSHAFDWTTGFSRTITGGNQWWPWVERITTARTGSGPYGQYTIFSAQPLLSDIEELDDGTLVLGITDRTAYQNLTGMKNEAPTSNVLSKYFPKGDVVIACKSNGTFVLESNSACGTRNANRSNGQGPGGGEFVADSTVQYHFETLMGALAYSAGSNKIVSTGFDGGGAFFNQGLFEINATSGAMVTSTIVGTGFKKANGLGDIEILCDAAPVQIGNRVWYDADQDGIQDPEESPIGGVTVHLYNSSGTLVGTAVTSASGTYYFSSNVTEAANGGTTPDNSGGGLVMGQSFTVMVDKSSDYVSGPLQGFMLTVPDATTVVGTDREEAIDSDAKLSAGNTFGTNCFPTINVSPLNSGQVNHTYDVGFFNNPANPTVAPASVASSTPLSVSVGDYVWFDTNNDGIQDAGEPPLPGVILTLTNSDGTPVTDIYGNSVTSTVTDANGAYSFDNLPVGTYKVAVTTPTGYVATVANAGTSANNSSTGFATSVALTTDKERDPTLDFGFVLDSSFVPTTDPASGLVTNPILSASARSIISPPPAMVSVGDYVWFDANSNGLQDDQDPNNSDVVPGLAGVTVTLTTTSGGPVTDVYGNPVLPQQTDDSGYYSFVGLPLGQYKVSVTTPSGYTNTTAGQGGSDEDSSTQFAISQNLQTDGMNDMTLDFGFIIDNSSTTTTTTPPSSSTTVPTVTTTSVPAVANSTPSSSSTTVVTTSTSTTVSSAVQTKSPTKTDRLPITGGRDSELLMWAILILAMGMSFLSVRRRRTA